MYTLILIAILLSSFWSFLLVTCLALLDIPVLVPGLVCFAGCFAACIWLYSLCEVSSDD